MQEPIDAEKTIGISFDSTQVTMVQASWKKKAKSLEKLSTFQAVIEDVKPLDREYKELLKKSVEGRVLITAIDPSACLIRSLFLPLKKEKDIEEALSFQAEPLLPFPIEQSILDWQIVSHEEKGCVITLFAVKKDALSLHLKDLESYGLDPEVVTSYSSALAEFGGHFVKTDRAYFILHVDNENCLATLLKEGKVLASQYLEISLSQLKQYFSEEASPSLPSFETFDFSQDIQEGFNETKGVLNEIKLNLKRGISQLSKQLKEDDSVKILITGEIVSLPSLKQFFLNEIKKDEIEVASLSNEFPKELLLKGALAIGLGLMGLPKSKALINFRKGDLAYSKSWKRLLKPALLYIGACLTAASSLYFAGSSYIDYKENELRESFQEARSTFNQSLSYAIKAYEKKSNSQENRKIIPIQDMSKEDIAFEIERMEKQIKEAPDTIALLPNTPRVSDVLGWLSTHPKIKLEKDENEKKGIEVESLSYTLVKRPEEKKKQNHYQVKIELEFTSATPKLAREFHDALIEPNDFVDPKAEIKWSSSRGRYRTSFFLKDKTFYPSLRSF
ncbi:pilus assembly protein PilM [Criblamydia sequanensis]|uniref:Type IV pilus assembly protein PilM n=1 Tax=Candidatus Criblamydia sequanensis CRIB-18 TaxID=1437425 RepID=A0A090E0V0_9BACT|nr:pilus assembly protein PilM [Criblamydia sequanensis]CDR34419.1 Conserved hypothetical protein [Criblamydia sequanensis CRIB-18]